MSKQLLIIVYKINVAGISAQNAVEYLESIVANYSLREDEELKNDYIIREVFLPLRDGDGESDVKIIYPIPKYTTSPEINDLVEEISNKIKEDPTNKFKNHWEKLVRELKIRKLNEQTDN
jgi:hypothetical protein